MNKKKLVCWAFLTSLVLLLTFSLITPSVSAADAAPTKSSLVDCTTMGQTSPWQARVYCVWLGGFNAKEFDLAGEVIKWLFLVLIILLIYSALSFASFPESAAVRLIIAIVGGALATF